MFYLASYSYLADISGECFKCVVSVVQVCLKAFYHDLIEWFQHIPPSHHSPPDPGSPDSHNRVRYDHNPSSDSPRAPHARVDVQVPSPYFSRPDGYSNIESPLRHAPAGLGPAGLMILGPHFLS